MYPQVLPLPHHLPRLNRQNRGITNPYPERIVQFGAGNFLRAFVDWAVDILNEQAGFASSVVVVRATPGGTYAALDEQNGLFHVLLQGIRHGVYVSETRLVSCISRAVYPYQDFESYRALARQPAIRFIFSNTTEAGIQYVASDQADDRPPSSFPAKLTQFLYTRYRHFAGAADKGCIIIPTELIEDNGSQLREMVLRYAQEWRLEADFSRWLTDDNRFCNTLVDRIVTGFPQENGPALQEQLGFEDRLLVAGERYHSWFIEAPPELRRELPVEKSDLNIHLVPDVRPYRTTKVRILNGLHSAMVPLGLLLGLESVRQCIEHETLSRLLTDMVFQEIIPSLDGDEAALQAFAHDTLERFRNPALHHRLSAIALNASAKIRARLLPTLHAFHDKRGELPARLTLVLAAYIHCYHSDTISIADHAAVLAEFSEVWQTASSLDQVAARVLAKRDLWGSDLTDVPGLNAQVSHYLRRLEMDGVQTLVQELNEVP